MEGVILLWIGGLLFLAYIIMNCIYGYYYTYSYNLENNSIIKLIEENLNGKLIYSFRNSTVCKSNEEELIIDTFEKTPEFCNCQGTLMGYGKCGDSFSFCKTVNSIPSNDFTIINSQRICVVKSDKSYSDLLKNNDVIPKDKNCPANYKSCGDIDTLGNKLCVKTNNNCPITKDDIENNTSSSTQILSVFKLRPNIPCADPTQKNWVYHGDFSPLTKICTKEDKSYEKIGNFSTNLYDLYKENYILRTLPSYDENELKKEIIYLYGRNFFGINKEKASKFSKEKILYYQKTINNCNVAMKVVTFILVVPIICLGGGGGAAAGGGGGGNIGAGILAILGIYTIPASLIFYILSIIIFVNNNNITSMLNIGSDEYMNEAIKALLAGSSVNFGVPLASIILFSTTILLGIIFLFLFCMSK